MMYKDFGLKLTPKFFVNDSAVLKKYRELHESFAKRRYEILVKI